MSPDPEGFSGKSPNLYVYTDNKPTDIIDPRGTFYLPVIAAGALIGMLLWYDGVFRIVSDLTIL